MKKTILIITVVMMLVFMLSACGASSSKLADIYTEEAVISRAEEVVNVINTLDYSAINAELRADLRDRLTAESLETEWDPMLGKAGAFKEYTQTATAGQKSKSTGEDYATVILVCDYEESTLTFTIVMDKDLEIVGMYLK